MKKEKKTRLKDLQLHRETLAALDRGSLEPLKTAAVVNPFCSVDAQTANEIDCWGAA